MSKQNEALEEELLNTINYIESFSEYEKVQNFKHKIETLIQSKFKYSKLFLHGSNASQLSLKNSDVDFCIQIQNITWDEFSEEFIKLLTLKKMKNIKNIKAKTSLVKFFDPVEKLNCDLSFDTNFCVKKADLINHYIKCEPRVRELILLVKYFVKKRNFHQSTEGYPNSLCYSMMCIHFFQMKELLPCFDYQIKKTEIEFDFNIQWNSKSKEFSISNIFIEFMEYYSFKFDYQNDCISVREGKTILKKNSEIVKTNTPTGKKQMQLIKFFVLKIHQL
jgi:DNA polymerase sigma